MMAYVFGAVIYFMSCELDLCVRIAWSTVVVVRFGASTDGTYLHRITVFTLPVIACGVGIRRGYGFIILSIMSAKLKRNGR